MENTKKALSSIPLLKTKAGPRDVDLWPQRLKEEYQSLIQVSEEQQSIRQDRLLLSDTIDDSRYVRTLGPERTGNRFANVANVMVFAFRFGLIEISVSHQLFKRIKVNVTRICFLLCVTGVFVFLLKLITSVITLKNNNANIKYIL